MKTKTLTAALILLTATFLTGCNKDENEPVQRPDGKIELSAASFTLSEMNFNDDIQLSRTARSVAKKSIKLSDGIDALLTIEQDVVPEIQSPSTRAEMPNQHYTIYVVKNSQRIPGAIMKGTVSGSGASKKFQPDASSAQKLILEPGTYTFVCYNDAVADDGTNLTVTAANAQTALIGTTQTTISGNQYAVHFTMKHQAARVRFEADAYWEFSGVSAQASITGMPSSITYNLENGTQQNGSLQNVTTPTFSFPNTNPNTFPYKGESTSGFIYVMPGTNGNNIKLKFNNGSIYRKNLSSAAALNMKNFPTTELKANESYTVKLRLYYSYSYLFHDGTTSSLADGLAAGKKPIGAVIPGNKAMALRSVGSAKWANSEGQFHNAGHSENFSDHKSILWGYEITYDAAQSTDHSTIKANQSTIFPAFYIAAHYNPGVTLTGPNLSKWFLPALGEVLDAYAGIGKFNKSQANNWGDFNSGWDGKIYRTVFVQAGGTETLGEWIWTSGEYNKTHAVNTGCTMSYIRLSSFNKSIPSNFVRPFIKF
jgi:hypothetical protein